MKQGTILIATKTVEGILIMGEEYAVASVRKEVIDVLVESDKIETFSTIRPRMDCKAEWEIYFKPK